jgi:hypothetical protein
MTSIGEESVGVVAATWTSSRSSPSRPTAPSGHRSRDVRDGRLDTDLLLTRTVRPLQRPLDAMLTVVGARPEGADSTLNIR